MVAGVGPDRRFSAMVGGLGTIAANRDEIDVG
jgi:hypothetical protein